MPIRIYALAKQLKLDSKVLADTCAKAGITGKGSALASLSDEEVAKIKAYMEAPKGKGAGVQAATSGGAAKAPDLKRPIRREDYVTPGAGGSGRVPVLPGAPKRVTPTEPVPPEVAPIDAVPSEAAPPEVAPPEATPIEVMPPEAAPIEVAPPAAEQVVPTVPPLASRIPTGLHPTARVPDESELRKPESDTPGPRRPRPPERTGPAIRLVPLPTAQGPPKRVKPAEPAPQKPDIRLPADAFATGKAGTKPLSEHLRKHEKKKKRDAAKKTTKQPPAAKEGLPLGEKPAEGRDRLRRGARQPARGAGGDSVLGGRETRQLKRKRSGPSRRRRGGPEGGARQPRRRTRIRRTGANTAAPRKGNVPVQLPCTVKSFSEAIGVPVSQILGKMLAMGTMSSITAGMDTEMAELLADEFGIEVDFQQEVKLEEKLLQVLQQDDDPESLKPRPPIVTFLGHVDHGKTSLLDRIIGIDMVSGEKGGITQHIRAYRVEKNGRPIAFVDTPGHEAFTEMRARGANVTDIAVLVVAADDGIMPQTEEAISHGRAAGVPIVVALNKMDLPGADPQRAFEQLAANELLPVEWGGDTEVVKTSATTGEGIDDLLETLLTVAELHEYSANPDRPGVGTCLEAELHEGRGVIAKLLVQKGEVKVGDVVVCGPAYGRIKAMYDTLDIHKRYDQVGPSTPVNITGLNVAPEAGSRFYVLDDISEARQLADQRASESRERELTHARPHVTLENLFDLLGQEDEVQTLNIILRADVRGSIEAIKKELTKLEHPEVQIKILQATVGGVAEADVHLADASDAVIIGFNVVPDEGARVLADQRGVQVRRYDIIYQVTEDLKQALEGMLKPEELEKQLGRALVQRTFHISRLGTIAGCRVLAGTILREARVRVVRDSRIIGDYKLDSLKRIKDDAKEVREGFECGIRLAGFNDLKEGDILEAYIIEEVSRTFETAPAG